MNRDDIIRMAREAGFADAQGTVHAAYQLEHFAALVAAAEREACAKVVDTAKAYEADWDSNDWNQAVEFCAEAIRARGQA